MAEAQVKEMKLNEKEKKVFDRAWEFLSVEWTTRGPIKVWGEREKKWALQSVQAYKAAETTHPEFQGLNPTTGFGMRRPLPEDLFGATTVIWDHNWSTAGRRSWMGGGAAIDAGTYDASSRLRLTDTANIHWAFSFWGVRSLHPSPKVQSVLIDLEDRGMAQQSVEHELRWSELRRAPFDRVYMIRYNMSFRTGVVVQTGQLGNDTLVPDGIVILEQQRAKATTLTRGTSV